MNRSFLLAGCAAVALFTGISAASAADVPPGKFQINMGGDAWFIAGWATQNSESGVRSTEFQNRFRLVITPQATAGNGLQYGGRLRIRSQSPTAAQTLVGSDQAFVFAQGKFGRIEAGVAESAAYQQYVIAPNTFGTGGIDGDWSTGSGWISRHAVFSEAYFGGGGGELNAHTNGSTNATKINYFTPRFGGKDDDTGVMGVFSYTPNSTSANADVSRVNISTTNNGARPRSLLFQDIYEVGLRYDGNFNGVTVLGGAFYTGGNATRDVSTTLGTSHYNNLSAYQFGAQVGYAGFMVGGSYLNAGKSGYQRNAALFTSDQSTWTAGISYTLNNVIVGFNYQHSKDAGDVGVRGNATLDLWSVGASYTIAPGLTTALEYINDRERLETGNTTAGTPLKRNADVVLWKTMVTF